MIKRKKIIKLKNRVVQDKLIHQEVTEEFIII